MEGKSLDTLSDDDVWRVLPSGVPYKWGMAQSHFALILFWLFTSHAAAACVLRFIYTYVRYGTCTA